MYAFITGPMIWLALLIFIIGMFVRIILYIRGLNWQLDRVAYRAHMKHGMKGAFRSVFYWLVPFATNSWRKQPVMTLIFFCFHIGAICVPLFLLAHNMILKDIFGVSFPFVLDARMADILSWTVIVSAILIILRRVALPEVRILTTFYDYFILILALAPFITGLLARYQAGEGSVLYVTHIISGEIFLILAPFTKLSHIVLFFMSRMQLGMDFGIKRGGMKGVNVTW